MPTVDTVSAFASEGPDFVAWTNADNIHLDALDDVFANVVTQALVAPISNTLRFVCDLSGINTGIPAAQQITASSQLTTALVKPKGFRIPTGTAQIYYNAYDSSESLIGTSDEVTYGSSGTSGFVSVEFLPVAQSEGWIENLNCTFYVQVLCAGVFTDEADTYLDGVEVELTWSVGGVSMIATVGAAAILSHYDRRRKRKHR